MSALAAGLAVVAAGLVYWRLDQSDYFWKNPLEEASFQKITDWPGTARRCHLLTTVSSSRFWRTGRFL